MKKPFSKSLSLRLLAIFIVTAALALVIVLMLFSRGLGSQWKYSIQPHLVQYVHYVHKELGYPPSASIAQEIADNLPVNIYIFDGNDHFVSGTNQHNIDPKQLNFRPLLRKQRQRGNENKTGSDAGDQTQIPAVKTRSNNDKKRQRLKLPNSTTIAFNEANHSTVLHVKQQDYTVYYELPSPSRSWHRNELMLPTLLAITALLLLSYWVIRRELSPIRDIQASVKRMTQGELDHRVPVSGEDDLGHLSNSINAMADRIQQMLDAKRQLLLAISHELRSPLARARVSTAMIDNETYRESITEDLVEMEAMIHDIMESERLQHHSVLNLQDFDLSELIVSVRSEFSENIMLSVPSQPVMLYADEARLRILFRNLLNNAIQHGALPSLKSNDSQNDTDTIQVELQLQATDTHAMVTVADFGVGINKVHLDQVTDAFFRPDESRTRSTGGFGLGLTLAKLIAQAHKGTLLIDSDPANKPGTRVNVTLPLND